jgi:unsaturated rhamnogalacturonyl hydrolase
MKKAKLKIPALIFFALALVSNSFAQIEYAEQMTKTIMNQYKDSMVMKRFAQHLLQDNQIKQGETAEVAENRPPVWSYDVGICLMGFERLIEKDGTIKTYNLEEYSSDSIPNGRQILKLYEVYKDEKYKLAGQNLRRQIAWMPRNKVGGFWHKLKYPSQMWLDGLYMVEPFYAKYAVMFKQPQDFDDIINQFVLMEKYSRDAKTGLLYHGWDESKLQRWANPKTGLSPEFWSRSMGWVMMALVDVLDYVPAKHPRRKELISILNRLSTALVKFQDSKSGVWWQITDKANKDKNYLESSATAMFVFSLAKAVNLKYIPKTFLPAVKKSYQGMIKEFVRTDSAGTYHYIQTVSGAGLGGNPYRDGTYDYYVSEPKRDDDLKAIGPFIQACIEIERLKL